MELTYQLTQRDFFDSIIAHRNRATFTKWAVRLVVFIFALLLLAMPLLLATRPNAQTLSQGARVFGAAALWAALIWGFPWWSSRNQFLKQPAAQGLRTMLLDAAGVHWRWNGGSADVEWKNYIRSLESKRQFLLYSSPYCFNILPKRALTPEQISEFRALLLQKVSRGR